MKRDRKKERTRERRKKNYLFLSIGSNPVLSINVASYDRVVVLVVVEVVEEELEKVMDQPFKLAIH